MDFREKREREKMLFHSPSYPRGPFFLTVPNAPLRNYHHHHHHKERINFLETKFRIADCHFVFFFSLLLHGGGDEGVDGLARGGELLHLDQKGNTVADELEELDLGVADTVGVGDIVGAVVGGGVDTTGTTLQGGGGGGREERRRKKKKRRQKRKI